MAKETNSLVFPAVPKSIASITLDYIVAYCKANDAVKWLKEEKNSIKAPEGANLRVAYFTPIRNAFVDKFFPALRENKTSNYKNILDIIDEL